MNEDLINAIIKIGNHPDFTKRVEPNLMWYQKLEEWMVRRVIIALELLAHEDRISEDTGGTVQEVDFSDTRAVPSDP